MNRMITSPVAVVGAFLLLWGKGKDMLEFFQSIGWPAGIGIFLIVMFGIEFLRVTCAKIKEKAFQEGKKVGSHIPSDVLQEWKLFAEDIAQCTQNPQKEILYIRHKIEKLIKRKLPPSAKDWHMTVRARSVSFVSPTTNPESHLNDPPT